MAWSHSGLSENRQKVVSGGLNKSREREGYRKERDIGERERERKRERNVKGEGKINVGGERDRGR